MKISKIIAGLSLVLLGTVAAFASAKQVSLSPVYFVQGGSCVLGEAEICPVGQNNCIVQVTLDGGSTFLSARQIFASDSNPTACATPYKKN